VSGASNWPPRRVAGLRWLGATSHEDYRDGAFLPDAALATAEAVVASIPLDGSLQFLDWHYHGQPPPASPPGSTRDEGAIFCVSREDSGLFVTCGNHGWSAKWHAVEPGPLATFLFDARASNVGESPGSDWLRIYRRAHYRPRPGDVVVGLNLLVRRDGRDGRN